MIRKFVFLLSGLAIALTAAGPASATILFNFDATATLPGGRQVDLNFSRPVASRFSFQVDLFRGEIAEDMAAFGFDVSGTPLSIDSFFLAPAQIYEDFGVFPFAFDGVVAFAKIGGLARASGTDDTLFAVANIQPAILSRPPLEGRFVGPTPDLLGLFGPTPFALDANILELGLALPDGETPPAGVTLGLVNVTVSDVTISITDSDAQSVPEPGGALLLGLAAIGLLSRGRK